MAFQESVTYLLRKDSLFRQILEKYGMPGFPSREQGFAGMCRTILEQQVSLDSARASYYRLKDFLGNLTPQNVIAVTDEQIRSCGITRQKSLYIRCLAEAVVSGGVDFESFPNKTPDEVRRELIKVKGIGNWTIDVYLMFSLQSPDVLPLGDIGIISAIKDLTGLTEMNDIITYTNEWSPHRTAASFFLWHYYLEKRGRKFPH